MKDKIINYLRSGHSGLYIVSAEEARVEALLKGIATDLEYGLFAWSNTTGLLNTTTGERLAGEDPMEAVLAIADLPENSLSILRDFHLFLEDANPMLVRAVREELARSKSRGKALIMLGCREVLPPELAREMTLLEFTLPDRLLLGTVLDSICEASGLKPLTGTRREAVLEAATGLTTIEAENAFALSVVEHKAITPEIVAREKAAGLKKNGLVEIVPTNRSLDDIGGLDLLKEWLLRRREAFSSRARAYKLPAPRGLLMIGVPGCGKSLTAKATATVLGRPLLKLDAGRIFGGLVGESEANLRSVLQVAEAIAPCVLWLDEIEKGFAGSKSSGATDGGTSARVLGSFLSWLQEREAPVFVVATANDVAQLPPEMLRKGRWDELFFVDLPSDPERSRIWDIQIRKHGRDPKQYDLSSLACASEGFTGAEIEQAFVEALYAAFAEQREPGSLDISKVLGDTIPLAKLMAEEMKTLRHWSKGRTRPASAPPDHTPQHRRIAT